MRTTLNLLLLMGCCLPVAGGMADDDFEWPLATPETQGFVSGKLEALQQELAANRTAALLVIRNEQMICEWYADGRTRTDKHSTASLAKAIVGGLSLAVAMEDGLIALDDPAWKYVPAWKDDPLRSKITVRHLGSHTSGIDDSHNRQEQARGIDQGSYTGWSGDFWRWRKGDQRPPQDAFTISRDVAPILFEPGTDFQYSNPGLAMLTWCVTASLKGTQHEDIRTLLRERIMRPIGVPDGEWSCGYGMTELVDGLPMVANWGGGSYTPRAVARIGRLVLHRGQWGAQHLLSPRTVDAMTGDAGLPGPCGMGWWTNADGRYAVLPRDAVWGAGAGHQILLVVPSLNLIAVRNGSELPMQDVRDPEQRYHDAVYVRLFKPLMEALTDRTPAAGKVSGQIEPSGPLRQAAGIAPRSRTSPVRGAESSVAPYPPSDVVRGVDFDFSSHRRLAPGSDNWPITWADDGEQYAAWGDGGGFGGTNSEGRVSMGVARIAGGRDDYTGTNVWGGFAAENPAQFEGKSYGILSVDGVLWMWVDFQPAPHLRGCRLAWSRDHGASWQQADWNFHFEDDLTVPTFLNCGPDYEDAPDEYVYSYYIHPRWGPGRSATGNYGFDVHRPGRIYLSRVPQDRILQRDRYEFFAGLSEDDQPLWSDDLDRKSPVFEDPNGVGWNLSVSHAPALNRYLLCTEHTATHAGRLGIFDAPTPWGPWSTVCYEDAWGAGHFEVSAFYWSFPGKWLSDDGRFCMAFSGKNSNDAWNTMQGRFVRKADEVTTPATAPYPRSQAITGIEWAPPESIIRRAQGSDNWPLTWADDDHLYTAYGDGWGFEPRLERKLSLGLARVAGDPPDVRGTNLRSGDAERTGQGADGVKASGMLMVDGVLYMLVRNAGNAQLAWSDDHAKTWNWADWKFTTSFGCPTFLNFGRNYAGARDEFVYVYSPDSDSAYEAADRMVMARVPQDRLTHRGAYEFLTHVDEEGTARWSGDVEERGAVFRHPGRCYRTGITFNAPLERYLWCHVLPESTDARGPRYQGGFAVYDAPQPWGPWTTVFFTNNWDVGPGETNCFPTRWMSDDGLRLHLVFSGDDCFSIRRARFTTD